MRDVNRYEPIIYTEDNINKLKEIPVLNNGQIYIYVILNYPQGNIKIGKTTNIIQRLNNFAGSGCGSNKITKIFVSPPTYIESMESTCHNHYHFARITGTEWFDGEKVNFNEVVKYVDGLFRTHSYEICNKLREKFLKQK